MIKNQHKSETDEYIRAIRSNSNTSDHTFSSNLILPEAENAVSERTQEPTTATAVNVTKPVLAGNSNTSLRFGFAYSPCTGRSFDQDIYFVDI